MDFLNHKRHVEQLQEQIKHHRSSSYFALKRDSGHSNTTRSKSYHRRSQTLHSAPLNHILHIDHQKHFVRVEPQITIEDLVNALLPFELTLPIVPELKGITVGGAIMGGAAESSSHCFGIFSDTCIRYELITGDGSLLEVTKDQNCDIFYALAGSYGSLGLLTAVDIQLIEAPKYVSIQTHHFTNIYKSIDYLKKLYKASPPPHFLDGIIFSKEHIVIIEGNFTPKETPLVSLDKTFSPWFYQYIHNNNLRGTSMSLDHYFFRYDHGAFWMGAYLLNLPLLARFLNQGIFRLSASDKFTTDEIKKFHTIKSPNKLQRGLTRYMMGSQKLWGLLHKAESWIQNRFIIQDFCIPETKVENFLEEVINNTGIFPLWLCPIRGTRNPQIFAPHLLSSSLSDEHFINVGVYGLPATSNVIEELTKILESKTKQAEGRKVLYSRSYYTEEEFWQIYSRSAYISLRDKTFAHGKWPEITEKVLSQ